MISLGALTEACTIARHLPRQQARTLRTILGLRWHGIVKPVLRSLQQECVSE